MNKKNIHPLEQIHRPLPSGNLTQLLNMDDL